MAVDPQAYSGTPIQLQNPLELATGAAKLQELRAQGQEHQIELATKQRAFQDESAMRDAARGSMITDPNTGAQTMDRDAYLSKLASYNPLLAQKAKISLDQQSLELQKQRNEFVGSVIHSINDPVSYEKALATLKANGDGAYADGIRKNMGEFDSNPNGKFQATLDQMKLAHLDEKQRFEVMNQRAEIAEKKVGHAIDQQRAEVAKTEATTGQQRLAEDIRKAGVAETQRGQEIAQAGEKIGVEKAGQQIRLAEMQKQERQFQQGKQQEAEQQTNNLLLHQNLPPEIKTAKNDMYQAKKVHDITDPILNNPRLKGMSDVEKLDTMTPPQIKAMVAETTKMQKGGVAGEGEFLQNLPDTARTKYAEAWQKIVSGKPEPGQAGAFMKQYLDYVEGLEKTAHGVAAEHYDSVVRSNAPRVSAEFLKEKQGPGRDAFLQEGSTHSLAQGTKYTDPGSGKTYEVRGNHWVQTGETKVGKR